MKKHFIDLNNFNKKQLDDIIKIAKNKKKSSKYSSILKNKSLGMIFEKQS